MGWGGGGEHEKVFKNHNDRNSYDFKNGQKFHKGPVIRRTTETIEALVFSQVNFKKVILLSELIGLWSLSSPQALIKHG